MTALENLFSPALTRALGWTLLHSLWQGALVAAVLAGALLLLRRQRAEVRYVASAGALGMVVALAGITFGIYFTAGRREAPAPLRSEATKSVQTAPTWQLDSTPASEAEGTAAAPAVLAYAKTPLQTDTDVASSPSAATFQPAAPNWLATSLRYFDKHLPLLVVAWLLGLLAMSLRLLGGLLYVQRLRRYRVRPLGEAWQARFAALAARSGVRRPVALLESALVQVPLVVGHVRPVILLPLGAVAGLPPAYLEAILAHELAHVLRRDYLVNLLQTVAEALFFYHPAVWFVANCVRTERENCCDDAATALVGGDALRLARALTALAEWSQSAVVSAAPRLALAAIGSRGALLDRVRRLVQRRPAAPTLAEGLMAGALVLGGLGLLGGSVSWAGPLAQPSTTDKTAAFAWQGEGSASQELAVTDTSKRKAGTPTDAAALAAVLGVDAQAPVLAPEAVAALGEEPALGALDAATAEAEATGAADTIIVRGRKNRARVSRPRSSRVIIDGRRADEFRGNPGTVVITKDKKGRLTDLVVNGQRVETEEEKRKIKDKKGNDQQVEIIRVLPHNGADVQGFVYRSDKDNAVTFERGFQRLTPYKFEFRNHDFERLNRQFGQGTTKLNRLTPLYKLSPGTIYQRADGPGAIFPDPTTSVRSQREALRTAERALREASSVKNLSPDQRKRLNQRLKEVQAQLKKLDNASSSSRLRLNGAEPNRLIVDELDDQVVEVNRERINEVQARREEIQERIRESQRELRELEQDRTQLDRDRRQVGLDRAQPERDRSQVERDRERAERDRERAERDRERAERDRKQTEAIMNELVKDGLLKDRSNYQIKLSATSLVVDGKTQPAAVHQKYLKLYESTMDRKMSATGSWTINRNSTSNSNLYFDGNESDMPRPPKPPRAPSAPPAPRGFDAPAPPAPRSFDAPAPPAPPRAPKPSIDTRALRDELRKDGLMGANDRNFQIQLNDSGLKVNGKVQSDELAAKYRKLMGHTTSGQSLNMNISLDD
ncbi:MAG TPA: M56 family metallopeptidase [Hymenobacter sp.]|jgi:beta-lactamase regulating signal transducer with metallopeptidase domain|uniref:M56 family metallopeptidase n=1 Tax=Hymenobacter sp. TaxID=1898978 RepID=UPI002ED90D2E